jgi:hypothetical protein
MKQKILSVECMAAESLRNLINTQMDAGWTVKQIAVTFPTARMGSGVVLFEREEEEEPIKHEGTEG